MAFARGRGFLTCFYCGSKSSHQKDGSVRQWKCEKCLAVNYLDENGDITDPPVATFDEAPHTVLYARPIPESGSPSPLVEDAVFCDKCLRNQHLYTSSLAQYLPDDPEHPAYAERALQLEAYKKALEERYPQICEKCLPQVERRLKQSLYSARSDHLRRMLERSRNQPASWTWKTRLQRLGGKVWWLGFFGQLLWDLIVLLAGFELLIFDNEDSLSLNRLLQIDFAKWSLLLSLISSWWHPGARGSRAYTTDYSDWYWFQSFWIGLRVVLWIGGTQEPLVDTHAPITKGAHVFMLGFSVFTAFFGRKSIKVKPSRIFSYDPTSIAQYVRSDSKPSTSVGEPASRFSNEGWATLSPSLPSRSGADSMNYNNSSPLPKPHRGFVSSISNNNSRNVPMNTFLSGSRVRPEYDEADEMDWTPTHSNVRALQPVTPVKSEPRLFNHAPPTEESSPFWYKVPPAPISPAQRLRNPPNQPRLIASSSEKKESFFNRITGKSSGTSVGGAVDISKDDKYAFAQPKFLPPETQDATFGLADSLETFTLKSMDAQKPGDTEFLQRTKPIPQFTDLGNEERQLVKTPRHLLLAVLLAVMLVIWNYALAYITIYTTNLAATIIGICTVISIRSLMEYGAEIMANKTDVGSIVGIAFGGVQVALTGYILKDLLIANVGSEYSQSKPYGSILIGVILAHEVFLAVLQQVQRTRPGG